jgi:uncharacterized protein (TIGR03437 family)
MPSKRLAALLASQCISLAPSMAQTTDFTAILTTTNRQPVEMLIRVFPGAGIVGALGNSVISLQLSQQLSDDYLSGVGPVTPVLTLWPSRPDNIRIGGGQSIPDPNFSTATLTLGAGGTGAYAGLTTTGLTLTLTRMSPQTYNVRLAGSITIGGRTTDVAITGVTVSQSLTQFNVFDNDTGTCSVPGLGSGNSAIVSRPDSNSWDDKLKFIEVTTTCSLSAADSFRAFVILDVDPKNADGSFRTVNITGGTGKFAGASGTAQVVNLEDLPGDQERITVRGTITQAGPTTPIISGVNTAYFPAGAGITQNDWIEIKGTNLVPKTTPAGGTFWSNAPEFAQGRMPTQVGGVSVTVNGKPAYVWWFCSAATTPACATDQINVLSPLDDYSNQVAIVVKNGSDSSAPFMSARAVATPSLLLFSARGDAVATHADGTIVGPTALFPGASTPARRGETISLWGVGFGLPATPLSAGSSTQAGSLPYTPACYLGGAQAPVVAALVSPGLYQFNVTIPNTAASGDNPFYCTIPNNWTLPSLLAVQ